MGGRPTRALPLLRTLLFVPGDRPDRIAKAAASAAAGVAVDLEDAVAVSRKDAARDAAVTALSALPTAGVPVLCVRINAVDSGFAEDDLTALEPVLHRLDLVMVPMSAEPDRIRRVSELLTRAERSAGADDGRIGIIPLVETAAGILNAPSLASADARVHTLSFGPADLSRELGITPTSDGDEFLFARSQLVLAAAAANCPAPVDGPYLDLDDDDGLIRSARHARKLGFGGKQVIHPSQIASVAGAFVTSDAEIDWARAVDAAFSAAEAEGVSSIRLADGTFVDYPVAQRARAILAGAR
ncbi:HpcH/HpaI aldolase/citrate lyase family protein [Mycolicibacterium smegmatis]|uniref:Malyl-CoA lyase n=2 Tax=Mycolicibacterium smegmatis (strain ATCC 700084 / mc(2)155) TaxID=246196 RepID=A0R5S8_MYCS2|nr:CoA ester lyase [Mycolicibacterium smegmatis]ABK70590.1 malyl-CoA lyase [Mycolicibacterium smegmatis MC2 155]AFP42563.1 Citrate lyase beta chain [Mycolicibacterium smegmatis MC2 155]AIU11287.1 citrate lyase [Mycolicibacterium smegmatis MC2 155]AIU17911.1 citrate lyase [Mycolicibacterium smegmatis]AIU24535.1 citrate lyase [Mycolicibacterium smegmatis]